MLDKLNWLRLTSLITLVLLTWKWIGLFLRKNRLLKCWGLTFFLNWIGALRKIASKKIGALIYSKKFLSPEVALYLNKYNIRWCVEYLCHVWTGTSCCYAELLDKLQKQICQTVGPSLVASLEPLACRQSVASLSLFYRYYLLDFYLNWLIWFQFLVLVGDLMVILINCMIFLSPFLDVTRMSMSTVSFITQLDCGIHYQQNIFLWSMI